MLVQPVSAQVDLALPDQAVAPFAHLDAAKGSRIAQGRQRFQLVDRLGQIDRQLLSGGPGNAQSGWADDLDTLNAG